LLKKSLPLDSAYLLVSHGSRDPRPQIAAERLASLVAQKLQQSKSLSQSSLNYQRDRFSEVAQSGAAILTKPIVPLVDTACLELAPVPLHVSIEIFAQKARALGLTRLQILPLFLLPGVHVKEDIPREMAIAHQAVRGIELELRPYLGSQLNLINLLAQQLEPLPATAKILLSHGSRRLGGNQPCEEIASQLDALTAYWSLSPTLSEQITALSEKGAKNIAILPYFLFTGGITDAIAQQVQQLQSAFPHLKLFLGQPLGATEQLADAIVAGINE
jgi:sirohydrochlorin ferrochelatase